MWDIPVMPRSGIRNCHAVGVYSFVFDDNLRMFACLNWTGLAANDYGDTVGFHNHHRDLTIKVAFGEIENIELDWESDDNGTIPYRLWSWDSELRGGLGRFTPTARIEHLKQRMVRTLTPTTRALALPWTRLHTIKQTSKQVGWFVREGRVGTESRTYNFSRNDLHSWHKQGKFYEELEGDELWAVWSEVRGYAMNTRKRNARRRD